ncbi:hypothetical protein [Megalodesulfovibrio paquesii]
MVDLYVGQAQDVLLGQDFLTWLWCMSERTGGNFRTPKGEAFLCVVEQRVVVQGGQGDNLETATVSGAMSELKEARLGLGTGKKVTRALIRLAVDEEEWSVTLKAEDFSLNSLKTPKIEAGREEGDDPDAIYLEKFYLLEKGIALLDSVYLQFLQARLAPDWPETVKAVREWIAKGAPE